jgi:hypothetical protein
MKKLTKLELLNGVNKRSNIGNTNLERLTWYRDRLARLEGMKETTRVRLAKLCTLDRIDYLEMHEALTGGEKIAC